MIFYYVSLFSLVLMGIMLVTYRSFRSRFSKDHLWFYRFLIILFWINFFESFTRLLDAHASQSQSPWLIFSGMMLFILFPISSSFWGIFINRLTFQPIQTSPLRTVVYFSPLVINAILTFSSLWTGWYFTYDPVSGYQDGPLFVLYFIIPFLYTGGGSLYAWLKRDVIYPKFHFAVTIFPIPLVFGAIVQSFVAPIPLIIPILVIVVFLVYNMLMEDLANVDIVTKLYTAQELHSVERMLNRRPELKKRVKIISITVASYRLIFEQYGPQVAQHCLFEFAQFLSRYFKTASNLTRLDSGEFIIFDFNKSPIGPMQKQFEHALSQFNDTSPFPFKVKTVFVVQSGDDHQPFDFNELIYSTRLMSSQKTGIQFLELKKTS